MLVLDNQLDVNAMKSYIPLIVFSLILLFNGCDKEKESECVKCNEALLHMSSKISQNNCNPNWMENAWNRITDDCGEGRDDYAVGWLAEKCAFGYNGNIGCTEIAYGLQISDNSPRSIRVRFQNGTPDDTVKVFLSGYRWGYVNADETTLMLGQTDVMDYTGQNDFGSLIRVAAYNTHTGDTIARGEHELRYNRQDQWNLIREIHINYDVNTQQYALEFVYW